MTDLTAHWMAAVARVENDRKGKESDVDQLLWQLEWQQEISPMPENPYEPPAELGAIIPQKSSTWSRIGIAARQALIVAIGATCGAMLCMPAMISPPPATPGRFIFAWLQASMGAVLGGALFAWTSRIVFVPPVKDEAQPRRGS